MRRWCWVLTCVVLAGTVAEADAPRRLSAAERAALESDELEIARLVQRGGDQWVFDALAPGAPLLECLGAVRAVRFVRDSGPAVARLVELAHSRDPELAVAAAAALLDRAADAAAHASRWSNVDLVEEKRLTAPLAKLRRDKLARPDVRAVAAFIVQR